MPKFLEIHSISEITINNNVNNNNNNDNNNNVNRH